MRVSSEGERQVTDLRSSHLTRFCNLTQYPIKQSLDQNPEKAAFIKRYVPDLKDVLAYKFMNLGVILRCHQPNPHFQLWRRVEQLNMHATRLVRAGKVKGLKRKQMLL